MSLLPPSVFGMWSISSVLFTAFVTYHLWHYDRFRCLRINQGPYSGAFKRVMTYTYLLTLPLITTYSVGNAAIKYKEGFISDPQYGVIPKPYAEWTKTHQNAVFPLLMLLALCFSLEMITHLEELCFWVFLMNATASSQNWFRSVYFLVWSSGSVIALIFVPTVSIVFRYDPLKDEAYTFLVGGCGSLSLTLCFVPILYLFPVFLHKLVQQGIEKAAVIRLQKFHELNRLRFIFKLLFVVPLIVIAIDGLKPGSHPVNRSMFWTEILGMSSAFGCMISSALTLLIFFPRNDVTEYETSSLGRQSRLRAESLQREAAQHRGKDPLGSYNDQNRLVLSPDISIGSSPNQHPPAIHSMNITSRSQGEDGDGPPPRYQALNGRNTEPGRNGDGVPDVLARNSIASRTMLRPNRLSPNGNIELGSVQDHSVTGRWVSNWTSRSGSPLDVVQ